MRRSRRLTEGQIHDFLEGKPVQLSAVQLTAVVRYMAHHSPLAVTKLEDGSYIAVSLRRVPGATEAAERWLHELTADTADITPAVQEAIRILTT